MKADDPAPFPDIADRDIAANQSLEGPLPDDDLPPDDDFVLEAFRSDDASDESENYPDDDDFEEDDQ